MKKRILSCLMALALWLTLLPATALAAPTHQTHPICGKTCSHTGSSGTQTHPDNAFENAKWLTSSYGKLSVEKSPELSTGELLPDDKNDANCVLLEAGDEPGYYYLSTVENYNDNGYVRSYKTIKIKGNVTICLNGMQIEKVVDNTGSVGPVFEVPAGSTLTLTDCTGNGGNGGNGRIVCNESSNGSGVYVNGGTLNLYSGQITKSYGQKGTGSNSSNKYGGGVYVNNGGTFNMYGGAITGNHANYGGGVYVKSGTFNMYGGDITRNSASYGGGAGVYVEKNGNFIMKNTASVTGNTIGYGSTAGYGGGVYVNGTFEMHNDASVKDNTANNSNGSSGGGVYVNGGTFKMHNNASVSGNKTKNNSNGTLNGAGVYVNGGEFEMNDTASITGNTATGNKKGDNGDGGGVYVNSGTFNMNGSASITKNNAAAKSYGGGVFVNRGTFNMTGGAIGGTNVGDANTAYNGGGVYMWGGTFNMSGTTSIKSNIGNGVCVSNGVTFTVSGAPTVTGNTKEGAASNVFLAGNAYITIGNFDLNGNANSIGVTKKEGVNNGVIAESVSTDCSGKFFSDDTPRHKVEYNKTTQQLVLTKSSAPAEHTHIWTYKANEATITATCTGKGNCDFNKDGGSVTINPPANLTQGSNGKTATVTVSDNWKGPAVNKITYWECVGGSDTYTNLNDVVPTKVGKYKASITVEKQTAFVVYEILASAPGKQEQDALHLASTKDTLAVGETLTLKVTGGSTYGAVTYRITGGTGTAKIEGNVLTAEKAGTVTVTATMDGNETFNDVTSGSLTITITENTGGTTPSQPGGSSSGGSGSYDSNPIIKTETKNNADGSTTKTETRKDGSVTQTTTGKDGSTGTVKTDKNGKTEMNAKLSDKAVEDAKKSGEAVKAPVEVEASRNSGTAPTVKVELPQNSGKTEVEIPVSNAKPGTVAVLVHPDGTEEILKASVPTENGIRLTMDGSATVKIIDNSKDFVDTRNHWAREEIDFVSARELVNGMSATRYAPDATATRAQLWTILARQSDANLSGGANWYEKAQLWSKDKGISDGTNPGATITRAQMVTMLWRTMGQPAATDKVSFADVPTDSYYAQAVAWAVEGGITQGVGGDRFDPNATCTRAQIAAFLARSMK